MSGATEYVRGPTATLLGQSTSRSDKAIEKCLDKGYSVIIHVDNQILINGWMDRYLCI